MRPAWRRQYVRYKRLFLNFFAQYKDRQDLKMFLEILLSLATISFFAIVALRPTLITIARLIKEIETKKEVVTQMDDKLHNINQAKKLYNEEGERIELLKTSVPSDPSPEAFVRQIEGLSAKHATGIISISIKEAVLLEEKPTTDSSEVAGELAFSVSTSSDYPSLFDCLIGLEKMRRPIKVDFLIMRSPSIEEVSNQVLVVEGTVPYLKLTKNEVVQ